MRNIALICALPQESAPILRRFPNREKISSLGIPAWRFFAGNNSVLLMESGMGPARAAAATAALVDLARPDMVFSIGFCGALRPDTATGSLILAQSQHQLINGALSPGAPPDKALTSHLLRKLAPHGCGSGSFITTGTTVIKSGIFDVIPYNIPLPVLEMESAAVIGICHSARIPAAALRTVSDSWDEDPAPLASKLFGPDLSMNKLRAAAVILANPGLLPLAVRLARNAKKAGESLATAVTHILEAME